MAPIGADIAHVWIAVCFVGNRRELELALQWCPGHVQGDLVPLSSQQRTSSKVRQCRPHEQSQEVEEAWIEAGWPSISVTPAPGHLTSLATHARAHTHRK